MRAGTGLPTVWRTTQFASTMEVISLMRGALYAALINVYFILFLHYHKPVTSLFVVWA